jgi:hypothetical protein
VSINSSGEHRVCSTLTCTAASTPWTTFLSTSGLTLRWRFFLTFGDEVRQAGSSVESIDLRSRPCQTPAPRCLKTVHQVTEQCCTLFGEFAGMFRDKEQRSEEQARRRLEEWTGRAKASGITELKAFAAKLLQ